MPLNLIDQEPELWTKTVNIIREECEKPVLEVKQKAKLKWLINETLKSVKNRRGGKVKGDKSGVRVLNALV